MTRAFRTLPFALLLLASPVVAEVPIEIAETGHVTVPVQGMFGERQFVLDTGAEGSEICEDFASAFTFPDAESTDLQGQTGEGTKADQRVASSA